jgi:WhiB family redox-sensing transcriptional regulator
VIISAAVVQKKQFFPVGRAGPALLQIARAKAVCAGCPVRVECREAARALGLDAEFGVWGGESEDERRVAVRRASRANTLPATRGETGDPPCPVAARRQRGRAA